MEKDFDNWNKLKKSMNLKNLIPLFSEREIWNCSLGLNVGSEEDGKGINHLRPMLIVRKFNKEIFYGIPITSKIKNDIFHIQINSGEVNGSLILSQMRLIDAKRLSYLMGKITEKEMSQIKEKLKALFP